MSLENTVKNSVICRKSKEQTEYENEVIHSKQGEHTHILFGHGVHQIKDVRQNKSLLSNLTS